MTNRYRHSHLLLLFFLSIVAFTASANASRITGVPQTVKESQSDSLLRYVVLFTDNKDVYTTGVQHGNESMISDLQNVDLNGLIANVSLLYTQGCRLAIILCNEYATKEALMSVNDELTKFDDMKIELRRKKSSNTQETAKQQIAEPKDSLSVGMVDVMPEFPGGTLGLMNYLMKNIKYPAICRKDGIQGRVAVSFFVNTDGAITDIELVNKVHPALDAEAIRVISIMPKWKPGMVNGKPVRVRYTVPVTFRVN